jgi:hypothetical protein
MNENTDLEADLELMSFFSAPKFSWKQTKDGFYLGELNNRVDIYLEHANGYDQRKALVDIPSDFIKLYKDVLNRDGLPWKDVHFKVGQIGKKYYFFLTHEAPSNPDGDRTGLLLWHWVPSNLPRWVRTGSTRIRKVKH